MTPTHRRVAAQGLAELADRQLAELDKRRRELDEDKRAIAKLSTMLIQHRRPARVAADTHHPRVMIRRPRSLRVQIDDVSPASAFLTFRFTVQSGGGGDPVKTSRLRQRHAAL